MASGSEAVVQAAEISGKWGELVVDRGFAQIPNYLLYLNQFLDAEHKLSAIELLVLLQIVGTWWRKGDLPFPSMATLADRCGISERQVQRAVARLEKGKFLKRVKRRNSGIVASNAYDLSPLVAILETVAKAFPNAYPRRPYGSASAPPQAPSKEALAELDALLAGVLDLANLSPETGAPKLPQELTERYLKPTSLKTTPTIRAVRPLLPRPKPKPSS